MMSLRMTIRQDPEWAEEEMNRLTKELAALKKDALTVATWRGSIDEINDAVDRILEATKEE